METRKEAHPTPRQLAAFALGKLTPESRGRMQEHLAGCATCSTFLSKTPRDTLVTLLRQAAAGIPASEQSTPGVRDSSTISGLPQGGRPAAPSEPAARPVVKGPAGDAQSRPAPAKKSPVLDDIPQPLREQTKYRIIRLIGRGGMGLVYEAYHERMDRRVALKIIDSPLLKHPEALKRFDQEVRAAANFDHPNLARAYDADEFGAIHVLVMEFVAGKSLDKILAKSGPMSVRQGCDCIYQAALGLQHALERGMVHRDLKPQNLMLTPEGRVKILDFGLAKLNREGRPGEGLTRENALMGTPHYLAPEQALDAAKADIRADIYSLGCTLYCLLAGSPPFDGDTEMKVLLAHQHDVPRRLSEVHPDVPQALSDLVARMLAKNPADRPQTPAEVAQTLLPLAKGSAPAAPPAVTNVAPPAPPTSLVEIPFGDDPAQRRGGKRRSPARPTGTLAPATHAWRRIPPAWRWPGLVGLLLLAFLFCVWGITVLVRTPTGTIVIENVPEGVEVLVDNGAVRLKRDRDEVTIEAVPQGQHTLKITRDGHESWSKEVTIEFAGQQVKTGFRPVRGSGEGPPQLAAGEIPTSSKAPAGNRDQNRTAQVTAAGWAIKGDELIQTTGGPISFVFFGNSFPSNYNYTLKAKAVSGANGFIILTNANDEKNCRWFELGGFGNSDHLWVSTVDGRWKEKDYERKPGWIGRDMWYDVRVEVRGPNCKCFLNGVPVFNHNNDRLGTGRVGVGSVGTVAHFKDILVTDESGKELWKGLPTLPGDGKGKDTLAAKPYVPPAGITPVDLLALIDTTRNKIEGEWTKSGGALRSPKWLQARVEIPFAPPKEYDIRVEFTPVDRACKDVGVICRAYWTQFTALVGAYDNTLCGFELYDGQHVNVNVTGVRRDTGWIKTGSKHEMVVRVRERGATLLLDGVVACPAADYYARLSLEAGHRLKHDDTLGLVTYSGVSFDKVELYEITGKGKILREQDAQPAAPSLADAKKFGSSYFKVFPERMSWHQARSRCAALGGHLAIIKDYAHNQFITDLVRAAGKETAWLGATDEVDEGHWLWVDGQKMDYTNWEPLGNQPNNKRGEEHFLMLRVVAAGKWCDQPDISIEAQPGFICQWD